MEKSLTFTEAELVALDDATDAGIEYLFNLIRSTTSDELKRILTERAKTLFDVQREKIQGARRNASSTIRSITFTKVELTALYDATDAGIKALTSRIMRAHTDASKQGFADAVNPLAETRKRIEEALRSIS